MNEASDTRKALLAYLLGELSPAERQELEERMLTDQNYSDLMQDAEYDLIDDYRAGRLSPEERLRVEAGLSRERLEQALPVVPESKPSSRRLTAASGHRPLMRFLLATAAVAFLLAVGWVVFFRPYPAPQVAQKKASPSTGERGEVDSGTTAVLLLVPGTARGGASIPLVLSASSHAVLVQWVVPEGVAGHRFRLSWTRKGMQNGKNASSVAQSGDLKTIAGSRIAEFHIDRADLPAGAARFLFVVRDDDAAATIEGEFQVAVSVAGG